MAKNQDGFSDIANIMATTTPTFNPTSNGSLPTPKRSLWDRLRRKPAKSVTRFETKMPRDEDQVRQLEDYHRSGISNVKRPYVLKSCSELWHDN